MRIGVVLRLVPDLAGDIELMPDGRALDLEWMDVKLNEFDEHALEEAVLIRESVGSGVVVALALDGEGADRMLQGALARGADEVAKIAFGDGPRDSRAATPFYAAAARELGLDLVLTGVQTPDDLFGQLAAYLGAALGWRHVSAVAGARIAGTLLEVQQEHVGGISTKLSLSLPAVVGIQASSRPPRYVSGSRLREVAGAAIPVLETGAAAFPNPSKLVALRLPEAGSGAEMLDEDAEAAADQIAAILRGRGMVRG